MATVYPGAIDAFPTNRADNTAAATNHPAEHNDINAAINAIEGELGVNPSSSAATVAARLASTLPLDAVADFGADPTGTVSSQTALVNFAAACLSTKRPGYLPPGVYNITAELDWRGNGLWIDGAGKWNTVIRQTTANTPGLLLGGFHQHIHGITVDYATAATSAHTNANAFEWYLAYMGSYKELMATRCGRGFMLPTDSGTNNTFSCEFSTLEINGFSISAISFVSTGSYSTGNVWTNIYLHNNYTGSVAVNTGEYVTFAYMDEIVINQLNLEHSNPDTDIFVLVQCRNATIAGLHFEGLSPTATGSGRGFVRLYDQCKVQLTGMSMSFNTIAASRGTYSAFRIGGGNVYLECVGLNRNTNTVSTSGTTFTVVGYDAPPTNGSARIVQADPQDFAQITSNDSTSVPNFKGMNEEYTDPAPPRTGPAGRILLQTAVKLENMPRFSQAYTGQAALATGTIRVFPLGVLRAYERVSSMTLVASAAGSGATAIWMGIARLSDRVVLARSANSTTLPTINTAFTHTFVTSYLPTNDEVVVGYVMFAGTTAPTFYGVNQVNSFFLGTPVINGTANTGQGTTPINEGVALAAFTADTEVLYAQLR